MKITIHQPEHMVWLGLLDKIAQAEKYVALDTVQYRKLYFQNRNRIVTSRGLEWLTVPVKKHPHHCIIKAIEISYDHDWTRKYLRQIENAYNKTTFFKQYYPEIEAILCKKMSSLVSLNMDLLKFLLHHFGISTEVILASELDLAPVTDATDVNLNICKTLNARQYLSGPFGKEYIDIARFENAGIKVLFHEFNHPEYKQFYEPFIPNASAIDLLFNHGPLAKDILLRNTQGVH